MTIRRPCSAAARQRGSATVMALGWMSAVLVVLALVVVATAVLATAHRADNAADLAALSGAAHASEGESVSCSTAAEVAGRMATDLVSCRLDGLVLTVVVCVRFPDEDGRWRWRSTATAGPVAASVGRSG